MIPSDSAERAVQNPATSISGLRSLRFALVSWASCILTIVMHAVRLPFRASLGHGGEGPSIAARALSR